MKNTVKFMFSKMLINMEHIVRENGKVYLVRTMDIEGRHVTKTYLGLDPDFMTEVKSKKKTKKEESD